MSYGLHHILSSSSPPSPLISPSANRSGKKISNALYRGVIEGIPSDKRFSGFYSVFFIIWMGTGRVRVILDLKRLNK